MRGGSRRGRPSPAYVLSWEDARDRRCLRCGRWLSEATTAGMDLRRRLRLCEPCSIGQAERRETPPCGSGEPPARAA